VTAWTRLGKRLALAGAVPGGTPGSDLEGASGETGQPCAAADQRCGDYLHREPRVRSLGPGRLCCRGGLARLRGKACSPGDRLRRQLGRVHGGVNTATNKAGKPIKVGPGPDAIAITPDGKTAYVANGGLPPAGSDTVTPIRTATNTALKPIKVGEDPAAIAITP
jgi:YVTN family beta-propeller protein